MKRLVAVLLSLTLPVMVTVGLNGPCPCADSIDEIQEAPLCCAGASKQASEKHSGSNPCDHCPCDSCHCERVSLPDAKEVNALVPSGVELVGIIVDASRPPLFRLPVTAMRPEVPPSSNGPPVRRCLADLCVRLL